MKRQGELVELKFYLLACERGYIISKPYGDNCPYDFIVDNNGRLNRVQIKSTSRHDLDNGQNRYYLSLSHGGHGKRCYTASDIDILVGYVIPENSWYIIPVNEINMKNIALYPHRKTLQSGKGRYEQFREAWSLF